MLHLLEFVEGSEDARNEVSFGEDEKMTKIKRSH